MLPDLSHDPPRDERLASALRDGPARPPLDRTDWDRLHRAIDARAAVVMAARRQAWWAYAGSWARAALPLALAAGVVLAVAAGSMQPAPVLQAASAPSPMVEEALSTALPAADRAALSADASEWLLRDAAAMPEGR
ncbi:MAG TPA: hypothetical protein VFE05_24700 [Longimicrobiaceae bacterium]|jgi:hypothetical protein|nr:hypothetical protein [Longimicrobiaceae bacterium]